MAELDLVELREKIARVIEPGIAWQLDNTETGPRIYAEHWNEALAKADAILALLSRLEQHSPVSDGWQPIETAPRDGTHIILAFGQDHACEGWWTDDGNEPRPWGFIDKADYNEVIINKCRDGEYGPSHWQPMPWREPRSRPEPPPMSWPDPGHPGIRLAEPLPPPPGGRGRDEGDEAESVLSDAPSPCTSADVVGTADVGSLPMPWRRFVVSAWEFLSDWHKGDFGLDGLAKHDAQSMSDAWPGPTQEDCPMCLGRGEVGGFVRWGEAGSWESEPCPQCQPPSAAGQSLNGLAQDGSTLVPLTAEMARAQADLHAEQAAAIADLTGKLAKAAEGMRAACDLLAERTYDNPARSPGHNARLTLEGVLREIEHAG